VGLKEQVGESEAVRMLGPNRTKVGLKGNKYGLSSPPRMSPNRTKVGLKEALQPLQALTVEAPIEPKWD